MFHGTNKIINHLMTQCAVSPEYSVEQKQLL